AAQQSFVGGFATTLLIAVGVAAVGAVAAAFILPRSRVTGDDGTGRSEVAAHSDSADAPATTGRPGSGQCIGSTPQPGPARRTGPGRPGRTAGPRVRGRWRWPGHRSSGWRSAILPSG